MTITTTHNSGSDPGSEKRKQHKKTIKDNMGQRAKFEYGPYGR